MYSALFSAATSLFCLSVSPVKSQQPDGYIVLSSLTIGVSVEVTDGRGVAVSVDVDDAELV